MTGNDLLGRLLALGLSDRPAIEWCGHRMTYSELSRAVDGLADLLRERGAERTHVLLLGPLCPAYVVGLLATLHVGAVPVPVDAGMRTEQYAWTERITRPSTVLTSDISTVTQYSGVTGADELLLDSATGSIVLTTTVRGATDVLRHASPDAGYIIPTSGSTGSPKAVVGSRAGLYEFLSWFVTEFGIDHTDVCAALTRVNFDPSLRELLAVLCAGGKLVLPVADAQLDPRALAVHLTDSRPTMAFLVPSMARRMAEALSAEGFRPKHLRLAFFAGEVLPTALTEQWSELAPRAELVNLYGMTEGTLAQLFRRQAQKVRGDKLFGAPVGRPRPGVSVTIADPDDEGYGEVLVESVAPALGVLDAGHSGESGTFAVEPMPVPLRTGDSGFLDHHGEVVIAGRLGDDLKVSG